MGISDTIPSAGKGTALTGISKLKAERQRRDADSSVAEVLKDCSRYFIPPTRIAVPKIKRRFTMIDPISEAWTMRIWFSTSAILFVSVSRSYDLGRILWEGKLHTMIS